MSAWSAKTRRALSRHCRDAKLNGHLTAAMHDMSTPPPTHTLFSSFFVVVGGSFVSHSRTPFFGHRPPSNSYPNTGRWQVLAVAVMMMLVKRLVEAMTGPQTYISCQPDQPLFTTYKDFLPNDTFLAIQVRQRNERNRTEPTASQRSRLLRILLNRNETPAFIRMRICDEMPTVVGARRHPSLIYHPTMINLSR